MPTPAQHPGGAAIAMIPMTTPGFKGLNTAQKTGIIGPEWATKLENSVIDDNSRVSAREGWASETSVAVADDFVQLFSATTRLVASSATKIYTSTNSGDTWTNSTGTVSTAVGNWQFAEFNDLIYGIQQGKTLIKFGASFAPVTGTSIPNGNCLLGAFGRLWATLSDGETLSYSALLNGDDWSGTDAGVFDLTNVWPTADTIQAIAAFNGSLAIFGTRNIVIYSDSAGSALGISPDTMYVSDLITGVGCISRDTIQSIDGDLWFLSATGVQSLGRLVQQKSNPLLNLSLNVQDQILSYIDQSLLDLSSLRTVYSFRHKLYLLSFPGLNGGTAGRAIAFDTRGILDNGASRCVGIWDMAPTACALLPNYTVLIAKKGNTGEVGSYSGKSDDGMSYLFKYESAWLDLTNNSGYLIIPKRYNGTFYTDNTTNVTFLWAFDFDDGFRVRSVALASVGAAAEFGIGEFGIGEFGGSTSLRTGKIAGAGTGRFIKLGLQASILENSFSVQQLDLFAKIGRFA